MLGQRWLDPLYYCPVLQANEQSIESIFKHIEQLQDYEQKKLQFTNDLFVAKIEKKNEQIEGLHQKLNELVDNINEVLEEL